MRKHLLTLISLTVLVAFGLASCNTEEKPTWETYKNWREKNEKWLAEQAALTNSDGTPFYNDVVSPTDPKASILMHMIERGENTLHPLYTSTVKVNYTVKVCNDSVMDRGTGYVTQLNSQSLITGWSLAIQQLTVGDSAQFILPYDVAYGTNGNGGIPPYSNLQFNIRLVDIVAYEVRP